MPLRAMKDGQRRGYLLCALVVLVAILSYTLSSFGPIPGARALLTDMDYVPHGFSFAWEPALVKLHVISDVLIGLAYTVIPLTLVYFVRKRTDVSFGWLGWCFATFIICCGLTHYLSATTIWFPWYWLEGLIKAITAITSVPTAFVLVRTVPMLISTPSVVLLSRQMAQTKIATEKLEAANAELKVLQTDLEGRVEERTTALQQANLNLERANARLRDADKRRDEVLAVLSHELRNPLHVIQTAATALQNNDPATSPKAADAISRQLTKMKRVVDDLLDISRIASGKIDLKHQLVDARYLLTDAVENVTTHLRTGHHPIVIDVPAEPVSVFVDPERIEQAISTVLRYAVKHTIDGGQIDTSVEIHGHSVHIAVTEGSVAIDETAAAKLFELFGHDRRDGDTDSLGIGLYISKETIALHGGSIKVEHIRDKGNVFTIVLPLSHVPVERRASAGGLITPKRLVVVEDQVDSADTMELMLEAYGHDVEVAYNGATGIETIRTYKPDVAFIDIGLPHMDGYAVAREIRSHEWGRDVVLIALTGWGSPADKQQAYNAGFDFHLTKPTDLPQLEQALAKVQRRAASKHPKRHQ